MLRSRARVGLVQLIHHQRSSCAKHSHRHVSSSSFQYEHFSCCDQPTQYSTSAANTSRAGSKYLNMINSGWGKSGALAPDKADMKGVKAVINGPVGEHRLMIGPRLRTVVTVSRPVSLHSLKGGVISMCDMRNHTNLHSRNRVCMAVSDLTCAY